MVGEQSLWTQFVLLVGWLTVLVASAFALFAALGSGLYLIVRTYEKFVAHIPPEQATAPPWRGWPWTATSRVTQAREARPRPKSILGVPASGRLDDGPWSEEDARKYPELAAFVGVGDPARTSEDKVPWLLRRVGPRLITVATLYWLSWLPPYLVTDSTPTIGEYLAMPLRVPAYYVAGALGLLSEMVCGLFALQCQ